MLDIKYKVNFTIKIPKGKNQFMTVYRYYLWDSKEDALAFKKLLDKATEKSKFIHSEVVQFVPEELI